MDRVRLVAQPLPRDATKVKIVSREWGIERCYRTPSGDDICSPAPFESWSCKK